MAIKFEATGDFSDLIAENQKYQQQVSRLTEQMHTLTGSAAPLGNAGVKAFRDLQRAADQARKAIETPAEAFGRQVAQLNEALGKNMLSPREHGAAIDQLAQRYAAAAGPVDQFRIAQEQLEAKLASGQTGQDAYARALDSAKQSALSAADSVGRYQVELADLDRQLAAGQLTEQQYTAKLSATRQALMDQASPVDQLRLQLAGLREQTDSGKLAAGSYDQAIAGLRSRVEAMPDSVEKLAKQQALLDAEYEHGMIGPKAYADEQAKLQAAYLDTADTAERVQAAVADLDGQLAAGQLTKEQHAEAVTKLQAGLAATATPAEQLKSKVALLDDELHRGVINQQDFQRELNKALTEYQGVTTATERYEDALEQVNQDLVNGVVSYDDHAKAVKRLQNEFNESATPTEKYAEAVKQLDDQLAAGKINVNEHRDAVENQKKVLSEANGSVTAHTDVLGGLGDQLVTVAAGYVSWQAAIQVVGDALRYAREETDKAKDSLKGLQPAEGQMAQIAKDADELAAMSAEADRLAAEYGVKREQTREAIVEGRNLSIEAPDLERMVKTSDIASVAAQTLLGGKMQAIFQGQVTAGEAVSMGLVAAGGSAAQFENLARGVPTAAEGGSMAGASPEETLALYSVFAGQFGTAATGAERIKSLGAKIAQARSGALGGFSERDREKLLSEQADLQQRAQQRETEWSAREAEHAAKAAAEAPLREAAIRRKAADLAVAQKDLAETSRVRRSPEELEVRKAAIDQMAVELDMLRAKAAEPVQARERPVSAAEIKEAERLGQIALELKRPLEAAFEGGFLDAIKKLKSLPEEQLFGGEGTVFGKDTESRVAFEKAVANLGAIEQMTSQVAAEQATIRAGGESAFDRQYATKFDETRAQTAEGKAYVRQQVAMENARRAEIAKEIATERQLAQTGIEQETAALGAKTRMTDAGLAPVYRYGAEGGEWLAQQAGLGAGGTAFATEAGGGFWAGLVGGPTMAQAYQTGLVASARQQPQTPTSPQAEPPAARPQPRPAPEAAAVAEAAAARPQPRPAPEDHAERQAVAAVEQIMGRAYTKTRSQRDTPESLAAVNARLQTAYREGGATELIKRSEAELQTRREQTSAAGSRRDAKDDRVLQESLGELQKVARLLSRAADGIEDLRDASRSIPRPGASAVAAVPSSQRLGR